MPTFGAYTGSKSPIMTWYGEYSYTRISNSTVRVSVTVTGEIKNHAASSWMGTGNNIMVYASAGGQSGSYEIKSASSAWYGNTNNPRSCSFAFDVPSSAAGESISVSYSVAGSGYTAAAAVPTQSTSFASPALLYVASMPSAGNPTLGQTVTIYTNPQYPAEMTHTVQYRIGGDTVTIDTGVGTSCQWTPPDSLAAYFPNAPSGAAAIICTTYVGSTTIGTREIPVTLSIRKGDAEFKPTCSLSVDLVPTSEPSGWGVAVKGYTKFRARVSAAGKYGSTIASYNVSGDGYAGASADVISSGPFRSAGEVQISASVTDSRGETSSASSTVPVYDYEKPKFTGLQVYRCTSDGTAAENGTYVLVKADFAFSDVGGKNSLSAVVQWKKAKDSAFANTTAIQSGQTAILGAGAIDPNASYVFRVQLTDALTGHNPVYQDTPIASIVYPIFLRDGGKAVGIGKTVEQDNLVDSAWPIKAPKFTGLTAPKGDSDAVNKGYADGNFAKTGSPNNLIHSGNEFTYVPDGFNADVWHNFRAGWDGAGTINNYYFGNGHGGTGGVTLHADRFRGIASSADYAGSAGSTQLSDKLRGRDDRNNNHAPSAYFGGNATAGFLEHTFKLISVVGAPLGGTYCTVLNNATWGDESGGYPSQIAINDSGMAFRGSGSDNNWGPWGKIWDSRCFVVGTVEIPKYSTTGSNGSNYYGDVSVSATFPQRMQGYSVWVFLQTGHPGTTGVIALEPISWDHSGLYSIRIHRASPANGVDGFNAYYLAVSR